MFRIECVYGLDPDRECAGRRMGGYTDLCDYIMNNCEWCQAKWSYRSEKPDDFLDWGLYPRGVKQVNRVGLRTEKSYRPVAISMSMRTTTRKRTPPKNDQMAISVRRSFVSLASTLIAGWVPTVRSPVMVARHESRTFSGSTGRRRG